MGLWPLFMGSRQSSVVRCLCHSSPEGGPNLLASPVPFVVEFLMAQTRQFLVNLIFDPEYHGYVADVPQLPGCMSQ